MSNELQTDWYNALIEECKAIITETEFTARWALVEGYHQLGHRILEDWQKYSKGNESFLQRVAGNLGVSDRTLYYAVQFAQKYPELDQVPEGKAISWRKLVNEYLPAKKGADQIPLPEGKYQVIYADPPWQYDNTGLSGMIEKQDHYPTMETEDIMALPVSTLSAENCVLFLWVTNPFLQEGLEVLKAWGFEYKTNMVWVKTELKKSGIGFYVRGQHEMLYIATKGSATPDNKKANQPSVVSAPIGKHSEKPQTVYKIIESLYYGPKIELFARDKRKGWEAWGNDKRILQS